MELQPHYARVSELDAEMYAISVDPPIVAKQFFVEEKGVTFPILSDSDPKFKTLNDYRIKDRNGPFAIPATFIVDTDGIIQWHDVGAHKGDRAFSQDILPELEKLRNTPPVIDGTVPGQSVPAGQQLVVDLTDYAFDEQDSLGSLRWEANPSETDIFRVETDGHRLTITPLEGAYGSARIRLTLVDSGGESDSQSLLVRVIPTSNTQKEIRLTVHDGLNLIHLPINVNTVNGAPRTITSISDLYEVLGGSANVHWLVTGSPDAPGGENELKPYFGGANDSVIEAEMGIFAALKAPRTLHLAGTLLDAPIHLNPGWNIVGIPHYDSGINRLSDLAWTGEIQSNASQIAVYDGERFIANTPGEIFPGIPSDRKIQPGQAILIEMTGAATIPLPLK